MALLLTQTWGNYPSQHKFYQYLDPKALRKMTNMVGGKLYYFEIFYVNWRWDYHFSFGCTVPNPDTTSLYPNSVP